jgi:hypothetical protein
MKFNDKTNSRGLTSIAKKYWKNSNQPKDVKSKEQSTYSETAIYARIFSKIAHIKLKQTKFHNLLIV